MGPDRISTLFDEWAAALARGEFPDPQDTLARAGDHADELRELMDAYLVAAPRREPSADALAAVESWIAGDSPLVEIRSRKGIRREDVVDAIVAEFELAPTKRDVVKRYYHELEAGLIEARGLTKPLRELLGRVLDVPVSTILALSPKPVDAAPAFRMGEPIASGTAVLYSRTRESDDSDVAALFTAGADL